MTDREQIIKIVMGHMHPWLVPEPGQRVKMSVPHMSEIREAAEVIVKALEQAGYVIQKPAAKELIFTNAIAGEAPRRGVRRR